MVTTMYNNHNNTGFLVHIYQRVMLVIWELTDLTRSKAQLRSLYFLFKEWNEIPLKVSNSENIGSVI